MGFNGLIHLTVGNELYPIYATHKCERWSRDNPTHGMNEIFREKENFEIIFSDHYSITSSFQEIISGSPVVGK